MATGKPRIGFIGLGVMGSRMAANILAAGYQLSVFDLDHRGAETLLEGGATWSDSPAMVAEQSGIVMVSLPDSPNVLDATFGDAGIASAAHDGLIVANLSTVAPATDQDLSTRLAPLGIAWLDCPVSGGPSGAAAGSLTVMVGGDEVALDAIREVLQAIAARIEYMGESGMGSMTKIVNQLAVSIEMLALCEAFTVGVRAGLDVARLWDVLRSCSSHCWAMDELVPPTLLQNDFKNPRFALRLQHKDVRIAAETARQLGVPAALTALTEQTFAFAEARGWGAEDQMAVINLYGEACGIKDWRVGMAD